jgi:ABC-2 type transport system ATP-binding protein
MSEMALTAEHLIVVGRGRMLADCLMAEFIAEHAASHVRVRAPRAGDIEALLRSRGLDVGRTGDELRVQGLDPAGIGDLVGDAGLHLHELTLVQSSLEDAFMTLTADSVDYAAHPAAQEAQPTR